MAYELIGSGGILDVWQLSQYESLLPEGDRGLVELDLSLSPPSWAAGQLENKLRQEGVEDVRVTTASPMMRIYFRKGFPWLLVIAAAVLGLIVLAVLIVGWRLFKEVAEALNGWLPPISAGLIVAIILGLALVLRERRK